MGAQRVPGAVLAGALAQRVDPADAASLANLAWFAARRGALAEAQDCARRAVARPGAPRAAWRTLERLAAGRSDALLLAAPSHHAAPAATGPGHPLDAAVAAHRQQAPAIAEACYRAAMTDAGDRPAALDGLAVLHEQRGEHGAADQAWADAARLGAPHAIHNHALALLRRGDAARARARLAEAVGGAPSPAPLYALAGIAALTQQDPAGALPLLEAAVAADPELARAHFALGLAAERLGQHARALEATRRGLLLSPWYVPQAWLLSGVGGVTHELPADGDERQAAAATDDVLLTLGRSLLETAHLGEALAVFDQVLLRHPSQAAALFHRGVVLAKLRRYGEALQDWDVVGRADPDGPLGAMSRRHARSARQLATLFGGG